MTEPDVPVQTQTAPVEEAQSEAETPQETSPQYLTKEDAQVLIEQVWTERKIELEKQLDAAYKTVRRGESKSDTSQKRIDKIESEMFELSLRGLEPQQVETERLKRQVAQSSYSAPDPNVVQAEFAGYARSVLEEEGIKGDDPVLTEWFNKYADGYQSLADLKVALARSVGRVNADKAKKATADAGEREKKAREEERTKLRNEKRQEEGRVDKGTPASAAQSKSILTMSEEEWTSFNAGRRKR